jgi:hypothetical protein
MKKTRTLTIVAGAAGEIGLEFCKLAIDNNIDCIGVMRNTRIKIVSNKFVEVICNLENESEIEKVFANIDFEKYQRIIYLHAIGIDKFEPRGYPIVRPMDTIPSDVYKTNVNTFKYLLKYCVKKINRINLENVSKIKFRVAIIAGEGDKHAPFVIESFCEAKYILRQYIQSYISMHPDWISGLSINITSTVTKSALQARPYADTKYWLTPKEVVRQSFDRLISSFRGFKDVSVIKECPDFVYDYYDNNQMLYEKWSKETGIS